MHRSEMRRQLFDVAGDLFAAYGYAEVTHADIAAAAGIGRTTFYEYFANKEDLILQLVLERLPELTETMVESIPRDLPPATRLAELTLRMIEFVATDHLGSLLHTEVPRLPAEIQRQIAAAHAPLSHEFVETYRRGAAEGSFRSMPIDVATRLIYDVIMAAGRVLMSSTDPKQRVHEVADAVSEFLVAGLTND